ncbi:MAG TPA: MATE family efflux transporter [Candidatus Merdisoma merdipullorum]|nr:MATE family efflux transporter [Candidatus Merdisoma merdipullorum]
MNETFMKEKPVFGLVLSMSLPMVLSMLVNSLYNIVDSYFVAKISEEAMTALSLVYPVQNLINAVTIGFGVGINAVIAFYLGAQEQENADRAATLGAFWNAVHGIVLMLVSIMIMPAFLRLFSSDEVIIDYALRYSRIAFSFSVVIAFSLTFEKLFQAVGRMTVSMLSMLAGCITNIILDPILIFGIGPAPELGIEGAALATGIGQLVTLAFYVIVYFCRPLPVKIRRESLTFQNEISRRLYMIGIPATLNLALPSLLISALNGILASFSEAYVLVLGVYYKLQTFLYLTANGIVQGIRPLIGYNYGAGEKQRVKKIFQTALLMSAAIMAVGTLISILGADRLFALFTTNAETIRIGEKALRIICMGFLVSSVSVTAGGALEGLGKGMPSLVISLMRYLILMIPAAFLISRFAGAEGVWHAFWVTEWLTALAAFAIYKREEGNV